MASGLPSSCRNWLLGNPSTVNPRSPYVFCSSSSFSYCGVSPHREATLTMSLTLSAYGASDVGVPSMVTRGMSLTLIPIANAGGGQTSPGQYLARLRGGRRQVHLTTFRRTRGTYLGAWIRSERSASQSLP